VASVNLKNLALVALQQIDKKASKKQI